MFERSVGIASVAMALLLATVGCGDFRSPAELRHAQILAVRLSSPELRAGEQASVEGLASDETGALLMLQPTEATLAPDALGRPIMLPPTFPSPFVREGDRWHVLAPDQAQLDALAAMFGSPPEAPLSVPLRFTFQLGARGLRVEKNVLLLRSAGATPVGNPAVSQILVAGTPAADTGTVIAVGQDVPIEVRSEANDRPLTYAWYSSVGEVTHYRSATAVVQAEEPRQGPLLVVVRNDRGGVGWKAVQLEARR